MNAQIITGVINECQDTHFLWIAFLVIWIITMILLFIRIENSKKKDKKIKSLRGTIIKLKYGKGGKKCLEKRKK